MGSLRIGFCILIVTVGCGKDGPVPDFKGDSSATRAERKAAFVVAIESETFPLAGWTKVESADAERAWGIVTEGGNIEQLRDSVPNLRRLRVSQDNRGRHYFEGSISLMESPSVVGLLRGAKVRVIEVLYGPPESQLEQVILLAAATVRYLSNGDPAPLLVTGSSPELRNRLTEMYGLIPSELKPELFWLTRDSQPLIELRLERSPESNVFADVKRLRANDNGPFRKVLNGHITATVNLPCKLRSGDLHNIGIAMIYESSSADWILQRIFSEKHLTPIDVTQLVSGDEIRARVEVEANLKASTRQSFDFGDVYVAASRLPEF